MVRRVIYWKLFTELFRAVPTLGPLHFLINIISKLKIGKLVENCFCLRKTRLFVVSSGCTLDEFYDQASKDLILVKS